MEYISGFHDGKKTFIVIGWDPWIKKKVNYFSCILEVKGGFERH